MKILLWQTGYLHAFSIYLKTTWIYSPYEGELYLGFCQNLWRSIFTKKAPLQTFDRVLNSPVENTNVYENWIK